MLACALLTSLSASVSISITLPSSAPDEDEDDDEDDEEEDNGGAAVITSPSLIVTVFEFEQYPTVAIPLNAGR